MRKIIVAEFVSLDGIIEDPGGGEKYEYGGWTNPYFNDEIEKVISEDFSRSDAFLLGRLTYQGFAAVWPSRTGELADEMNGRPKYVVSEKLKKAEWNNSTLIKGNIVEEIAKLKQQLGRDILIVGSGALISTLSQSGLIGEYSLLVYPLVLGRGKHLFRDRTDRIFLKLIEAKPLHSGVVHLLYQRSEG